MTFRMEFKNHLKALSFLLITTALIFVGSKYFNLNSEAMLIGFAFYSIFFLPSLYLHVEYYLRNRGQQLEVLEDEIRFYDRNGQLRKYRNEDLKKIILYKSANLDKGGIPLMPIESYHYARIIPKQGEEIILTCLMAPDVEEAIKRIKWVSYERKKRLFASLFFSLGLL